MRILFITDRNLTHDIRVFNEIYFASSIGHSADLIAIDEQWSHKIESIHIDIVNPRHSYYLNPNKLPLKAISTFTKLLYPLFKNNLPINAISLSPRTLAIWNKIMKLPKNYDLIIAHGFESLFPAYAFAKKINKPFAFDVASYIPKYDFTYNPNEFHKHKLLFKLLVPKTVYFTYSTDLVGHKILRFLSKVQNENFTLLNSYDESFFSFRPSVSNYIEFVWIAQKIDLCPDLELILPVLERFKNEIRLNIFGQVTDRFLNTLYQRYSDFIVLHKPLPVDQLLKTVAAYDIGLAVYLTYVSPEKNYTLSNKIFAYAQNGLFTIASDTISHRLFFSEHPILGQIVLANIEHLTEAISNAIKNINKIRQQKNQRYLYAKRFSWKYESTKLRNIWTKIERGYVKANF